MKVPGNEKKRVNIQKTLEQTCLNCINDNGGILEIPGEYVTCKGG